MATVRNDVSLGRQALRRSVNERTRNVIDGSAPGTIEVFCECGRVRCASRVQIAIDAYDDVLERQRQYVVLAGHEDDRAEVLVARQNGYLVVERAPHNAA
jgi:hypothetical protein